MAQIFILRPYLRQMYPNIADRLEGYIKSDPPKFFFMELLERSGISPELLEEEYKTGQLLGLINRIGVELYERDGEMEIPWQEDASLETKLTYMGYKVLSLCDNTDLKEDDAKQIEIARRIAGREKIREYLPTVKGKRGRIDSTYNLML